MVPKIYVAPQKNVSCRKLTDLKMVSPNLSPNSIRNYDNLLIEHKTIVFGDETLAVQNMIDYIPQAQLASDCIDRSLCHPEND